MHPETAAAEWITPIKVGPPSLRGYGGTVSGFQLHRKSQVVFGETAPSGHALGGACLLSPVATTRRLGSIKLCNGHIDRRIGRASTPGERVMLLHGVEAPVGQLPQACSGFVKRRLKFTVNVNGDECARIRQTPACIATIYAHIEIAF